MGMDISEKGETIPLWKKKPKRCVLMDELKCSYFETAILAGIPMMSNEKKQNEAEEAEDIYKRQNNRTIQENNQLHSEGCTCHETKLVARRAHKRNLCEVKGRIKYARLR